MAFQSAERFGFTITLPFGPGRAYKVASPPIEVGNYMIETFGLAARQSAQIEQLTATYEALNAAEEGSEEAATLTADIRIQQAALRELAEKLTLPDEMAKGHFEKVLGPAYAAMVDAGEPFELVKLAASTVGVWVLQGREAAEQFWNDGGRPGKARRPGDRKTKKRATSR